MGWPVLRSVVVIVIVIVGLFWGAVGPMVLAAGSVPHPLRGGPTRNKDDEMEECRGWVHCCSCCCCLLLPLLERQQERERGWE